MKRSFRYMLISSLIATGLLSACGPTPSMPSMSYPYPSATPMASGAPGGLASLLTGQVVTGEEQQLRDIQKRQILLDFPIRVGIVFYNLNTRLDATDLETQFDEARKAFKDSGLVRETIQIPNTLISGAVTVDELRRLGARFQCDTMILVTGSHRFERSKSQNLSFFDSFSEKAYYESEMKLDAIALDVYTGTLLSPFDSTAKATPFLLDRAAGDFNQKSYDQTKQTEVKAWVNLQTEAIERLTSLKVDVDKRKAELAAMPSPSPTPAPTVSPSPAPTVSPSPMPSAQGGN